MKEDSNFIEPIRVDNPDELFKKYKKTKSLDIRNQLVMHYIQNVNMAILSMKTILLSNIPYEDFFNQGVIALMDCIDRYDPDRGVATFDTYCYMGVRGGILKYLRKQNWLPNRLWEARKRISEGRKSLEQTLMREPTDCELANYLEIEVGSLGKIISEISVVDTISFEELISQASEKISSSLIDRSNKEIEHELIYGELQVELAKAIETLSPKEMQVISLYYYEQMNLREIGEILDISQQRVSQIRKAALGKLETRLREF